jgi:hypothetical protein
MTDEDVIKRVAALLGCSPLRVPPRKVRLKGSSRNNRSATGYLTSVDVVGASQLLADSF